MCETRDIAEKMPETQKDLGEKDSENQVVNVTEAVKCVTTTQD